MTTTESTWDDFNAARDIVWDLVCEFEDVNKLDPTIPEDLAAKKKHRENVKAAALSEGERRIYSEETRRIERRYNVRTYGGRPVFYSVLYGA